MPASTAANGVAARPCDCPDRKPVIQAAAPASARPSGSTLRTPQHACRFSTELRKPLMPSRATSASIPPRSGAYAGMRRP